MQNRRENTLMENHPQSWSAKEEKKDNFYTEKNGIGNSNAGADQVKPRVEWSGQGKPCKHESGQLKVTFRVSG